MDIRQKLPLTADETERKPDRKSRLLTVGTMLVAGALVGAVLFTGRADTAARLVDTSKEGITEVVHTGDAIAQIPAGVQNDIDEAYQSNPLYWDPHLRDHIKLSVTPSNTNCGPSGKELIRPFYVNSAQEGDPKTFHWCDGGTCHLTLEMGGDTLHHDIGFLKLRGCPVREGYTVPYLRIMKVLMGSYDIVHLGWGACDEGETDCEVGNDVELAVGDCKTLAHPSKPQMKYDLCYHGPGHY